MILDFMYVYIHSERAGARIVKDSPEYGHFEHDLYTVGFYTPEGKWQPESDHGTRDDAAARVRYLNGGK